MKLNDRFVILIVLAMVLFSGCQKAPQPVILISREYKPQIRSWLEEIDDNFEFVNMYAVGADSIGYFLERCSGILISGGPDVNPALYGMAEALDRCEDIDYKRDTLEFRMIKYAMDNDIPLLCICRGQQILNVANRGTLIPDIPTDYYTPVTHRRDSLWCYHWITLVEGTLLYEICQVPGDTVNSSHHQAVDEVAPGFRFASFAGDSLIESIELSDTTDYGFILGVQWHPESMDITHPLSGPIARYYIDEVREYYLSREYK
jgi:putative glutamine amidotransferase